MADLVSVDALSKAFPPRRGRPGVLAVKNVSFALIAGECLAIVGESGAGKSTVARLIVGLEQPTSGRVLVLGSERTNGRVSRTARRTLARQVQMVFQDPYTSLDPRQTVSSSLDEVLRLHFDHGAAKRARRVAGLLDQVGLASHHGAQRPAALSGGQRQRVAIARALAAEPSVLILDEAVSALDVSVQSQILNLLGEIRERDGMTYLFISHDLAVVSHFSDRVLVMRAGEVVEEGQTSAVLRAPSHPYTRTLEQSIPKPGAWQPSATALLASNHAQKGT